MKGPRVHPVNCRPGKKKKRTEFGEGTTNRWISRSGGGHAEKPVRQSLGKSKGKKSVRSKISQKQKGTIEEGGGFGREGGWRGSVNQ